MNGAVHYLVGALITLFVIVIFEAVGKQEEESSISKDVTFTFNIILVIIILSFLSHAVLDPLSRFTYHPSESSWGDPTYAGWHILTYLTEAIIAIWILKIDIRYVWGLLGSVGFDLWDWSIVRPLSKFFGIDLPTIHWIADAMESALLGWTFNLRDTTPALITEVLIFVGLTYTWNNTHQNILGDTEEQSKYNDRWSIIIPVVLIFGTLRLLTLV